MDNKILGLVTAAALATVPAATSYADMLKPIPNAAELLKAVDAQPQKSQFHLEWGDHHHHHNWHHHHHHHGWYHHHHHHHHNWHHHNHHHHH